MNNSAPSSRSAVLNSPLPFGAVILAAGSSSRLGQPKQLLLYENRPLVTRAAEAALAAGASPVIVVLGAHAEKIRTALAGLPILIVENPAWSEGMASSLRSGLAALESASPDNPATSGPVPGAVLLALCDQPHFSASSIERLTSALTSTPGATIAATQHSSAGGGVPAIFARTHFPALHALRGPEGARRIIAANTATTALVDLPELAFDIDIPADWQRLNSP
jgi:molybdenum cofactor cytidylyltransferase